MFEETFNINVPHDCAFLRSFNLRGTYMCLQHVKHDVSINVKRACINTHVKHAKHVKHVKRDKHVMRVKRVSINDVSTC